jgi:hypothetical protein
MRLLAAVAGAALIVSTIALAQSPAPQAGMQAPQIISAKTDWPIHNIAGRSNWIGRACLSMLKRTALRNPLS